LIAAVARALNPGCKVDTVLVLAGPQGIYKSTFFRVLASAEWFSDAPVDMHDKDSRLLLRRCYILEWAELDALQRAKSATSVKAFITSQVDQVRPPYARALADFPRTCIIVGTTNQDAFLADSTGSRRYWVIELDRKVNLPLLTEWRDQLWAEAVAAFNAGENWHLHADEERALAAANQAYEQTDPWEELVLEYAEKRHAIYVVTVEDILRNAVGKDPKDWSGRDKNRVVDILKRAGWKQDGRKRCDDGKRVRRWEPPRPTTSAA
jgi:predicted P-loop ATPase